MAMFISMFVSPKKSLGLAVFVLAITSAVAPGQIGSQRPSAAARANGNSVEGGKLREGGKLKIGEVISLLRSVRSGRIKQARLVEALQTRGIDFPASELNLARLMNGGAPEAVLELIEKLESPPPCPASAGPVKPLKPTYILVVTCEPAECEIRIGDHEFSKTINGKSTFVDLPAGRIILDAKREGFEAQTDIVVLNPVDHPGDGPFQHTVKLIPTDALQQVWGAKLLDVLLSRIKINGDQATISGLLTITDSGSTQWKLTAGISASGLNSLDLENSQGKVGYSSSAGFWQTRNSSFRKSPFRGTQEEKFKSESALLRNVDTWIAFEYTSTLRRIRQAGSGARSRDDPSLNIVPRVLEIKSLSGSQSMILDTEFRPHLISIPNSSGGNSAAQIEYTDYRKMSGGDYPGQTMIQFADLGHSVVLRANEYQVK